MRVPRLALPALAAACLCTGCVGPLVQSGAFAVSQGELDRALRQIRPSAAFALDCAPDRIQYVTLALNPFGINEPQEIGASGCGRRVIFVAHYGYATRWVPTGATGAAPAPQ